MKNCFVCGIEFEDVGALCDSCRAKESALVASFGEDVDKEDPDAWRDRRDDAWMRETYSL